MDPSRRVLLGTGMAGLLLSLSGGLGKAFAAQEGEARTFTGENVLGVPYDLMAACQEGLELIYARRYPEALQHFERLGIRKPERPEGPLGRALVYQAQMGENYDGAQGRFYQQEFEECEQRLRAVKRDSRNPGWENFVQAVLLGCDAVYKVRNEGIMAAVNRGWDALQLVKEANRLLPEFHDLKLALGMYAYWRVVLTRNLPGGRDNPEVRAQGIADMEQARREGYVCGAPARLALAYSYSAEREFDRGLEETTALRAAYPDNILNLQMHGRLLTRKGRYEEAQAIVERCFEIDPEHKRGYWMRADILFRQNQEHDATIAAFERYLATEPPDRYAAHSWFRIGQIHRRQRKFDTAAAAFRQALELDRGFKPARERLREVEAEAAEAAE